MAMVAHRVAAQAQPDNSKLMKIERLLQKAAAWVVTVALVTAAIAAAPAYAGPVFIFTCVLITWHGASGHKIKL